MAMLAIYDNISTDDENAGSAAIGLFIIASFFAVPYFVFFRPKSKEKSDKKRTLTNKRCHNCSSTDFTSLKNGEIQCKHCGSIYS